MSQEHNSNLKTNWESTFNKRGDHYNKANEINPLSRKREGEIIVEILALEPDHIACDIPAGGGYLAECMVSHVRKPEQIACIEPSEVFAKGIKPHFRKIISPLHDIPLEDGYFDRIGSLAGLHHSEDKLSFFYESYRILKPGGRIAVADVELGSHVAKFLNNSVDRYTETGHKGIFFKKGEMSELLRLAGFTDITEEVHNFYWEFDSRVQMVKYCRSLFGMVKADEQKVGEELYHYFSIVESESTVKLPWSLIYASANK